MLLIRRMDAESWRDATARVAGYLGVSHKALELFDKFVASGDTPETAAKRTARAFDVTSYIPEGI